MKKFINLLVAAVFVTALGFSANAQSPKLGHIDSSKILEALPERTTMEQELQTYYTELQSQLQTMASEYQSKVQEYEAQSATMSNLVRQSKEKEILDLQNRIQEFQQNAEAAFEQKRAELLKPLIEKIQNAVNSVGKEKSFTYIFDIATGATVYIGDNAVDITDMVKTKLGIK